ncbi:MAG: hypothetical protein ACE5LB_13470 [Acidiferrobacterales bacterium]
MIRLIWRIAAGALAVLALALTALRLYTFTVHGPPEDTGDLALFLGIVFPLSLGLLFGYFAIIGKIPGKDDK